MDPELIDSNILVIVGGLGRGIPETEIIQAYLTTGFSSGDIFLLLTAAKILLQDRAAAVKPRGIFRRTP